MKWLRCWMWRMSGMFFRDQQNREFAAEIESHLQMHTEDNLRAGMTPEHARREAILKLGGVEPTTQAYRERGTVLWLEDLLQDFRFAVRQWQKNPGFAFTAVLILSLGICASVAIFGFVDAALLKPLPYEDASRLAGVTESIALFPRANLSYLDYLDWKKLNNVFSSLDVYNGNGFNLTTPTGPQRAVGARVSDGFFRTLGVTPAIGRDFHPGEDRPGAPATVLLSYTTWQEQYGGKTGVLGQTVTLDGEPNTIIGVLPRDFHFAPVGTAAFWKTLNTTGGCEKSRSCHNLKGVGRLKDGVSIQAALADTTLIAQQLEKQYPDSNRGQGASVVPLSEVIVGDVRPILLVLLSGAGLLLLIACVNVASLLLARSESRKREFAVRGALGASSARLIRQFATEGTVMTAAATAIGLAAAYGAMQLLTRLIPANMLAGMPYLRGLGLNLHVLAAAGAMSLLAALLFSVTPALRLSTSNLRDGLVEGNRGSAGMAWRRLGSKLVVLELATAMVLLAGAGLLSKSFYRLLHVEIGMQPDHLAIQVVGAPASKYAKDEQQVALARQVIERTGALPGVQSVGIASQGIPVTGNGNTGWIRIVGRPYNGEHNEVPVRNVSSAYFSTIQAKLLRGRCFTDAEDTSKPGVAVINQALAKKYFPGENPIGQRIGDTALSPKSIAEIIGIVDDIREGPLDQAIVPALYLPFNQNPDRYFYVVARTSQSEQSLPTLSTAIDSTIRDIDPGILNTGETTMNELIQDSPSAYMHRSSAWLVGGFAAVALLLGVVGLYGVIAYSVGQRTREIGVRMALGAQRSSVYQLVLKEAGWLTVIGILVGLAGAMTAAMLMRKLLFGIRFWDVPTLIAVSAVLGIAALLASYIPARRAASVNPVEALRAE